MDSQGSIQQESQDGSDTPSTFALTKLVAKWPAEGAAKIQGGIHQESQDGSDTSSKFAAPRVVAKWLAEGSCCLVDAREEAERNLGVLPGCICIGISEIIFQASSLKPKVATLKAANKRIVCYTNHGAEDSHCIALYQHLMENHHFPKNRLFRLRGGVNAWKTVGLEICHEGSTSWCTAADSCWRSVSGVRPRWKVVGGADNGGLIVRVGRALGSEPESERLAKDAVVEELKLMGERLKYRRMSGIGPDEGWVTILQKDGTALLRPMAYDTISGVAVTEELAIPSLTTGKKKTRCAPQWQQAGCSRFTIGACP